jgi:phosphate transport system permease protein
MTDTRTAKEQKLGARYETSTSTRYAFDRVFAILVFVATIFGLVVLGALLVDVFVDGLPQLSLDFITNFPSSLPDSAGIFPALIGSLWLLALTALIAVPLGIGAAVYLEEYAADTWANRLVEINISNLAGVPSIVYGLLALGIFVNVLQPITGGKTVLSGALALSLLILPVIIIATREALRAIPDTVREGGYALGATRWEVIRYHLLPMAMPGALTGTILALSRAVGETAPLLVVGAVTFITFAPEPFSEFTALPIQIYYWISQPQDEFKLLAAAAIVVLMAVLILTNSFAIWLRNRTQRGN